MKYGRAAVIAAIATASLALAACSAPAANDGTSSSAPSSAKIGVVLKTASNAFWATMQQGAETEGSKGGVKVTVQSASTEDAIEEQTGLLATLSGGDYGCYAVAPITGTNLNTPLKTISDAGKPIINLDSAVESADGINITTFIASNNEDAGKQAGVEMAKLLGGAGKVAVIGGLDGNAASIARTDGFTKAAKAAGLTVVQQVAADWDREKALNAATTILGSNPDLGGFYSANDGMALGIVQATQNAGLKNVKVIGTDGDKEALQSIADGGMAATVSQYPYLVGLLGVDACRAALGGATLPKKVDARIQLVTADNAKDAITSFPQPFAPYENPFTALINK